MLILAGCSREPEEGAAVANVGEMPAAAQAPVSKPPPLIARPADQAELDRLILAGYNPHADICMSQACTSAR